MCREVCEDISICIHSHKISQQAKKKYMLQDELPVMPNAVMKCKRGWELNGRGSVFNQAGRAVFEVPGTET